MTAKRRAAWAGVASVLWLLLADATAQEWVRRPPPARTAGDGRQQRMMPPEQRDDPAVAREASTPGEGNRLSPEERRQLRRDVHEAGRDLYMRGTPRGRADFRR